MSKSKKNKKERRLRREIEMLKAQVNLENPEKPKSGSIKTPNTVKIDAQNPTIKASEQIQDSKQTDRYVKQDLLKTITIASVGFGIIIAIWVYQTFF